MLNDLLKKGSKKVEFQGLTLGPILSRHPVKNQSDESAVRNPLIPLPLHFKKTCFTAKHALYRQKKRRLKDGSSLNQRLSGSLNQREEDPDESHLKISLRVVDTRGLLRPLRHLAPPTRMGAPTALP